ncbi:MAG: isoleucine--tRNA ligase [Nanoarchaeota archaeon]
MEIKNEEHVLEFWAKEGIYGASKKKNSNGKKFYMMDGPPYATGHIHLGTALNKTSKDIAMRMKRMQGYDVFDRPGYDTHGVPIELQVEKEIDSKSKRDIEKFGVENFIERCKKFATQHIDIMNREFLNLGVWMDWENPYLTLSDDYIEAIWHAFKEAHKKGLLYLGKYPIHVCPRCETAVAYNEIEYAKQKDNSVYVKFPIVDKKNSYLIIWTTTPWTLPANTGVMVGPKISYREMELKNEEKWIVASELADKLAQKFGVECKKFKEIKGNELEGLKYSNPLKGHINVKVNNGYRVVLSDRYVTTNEGTGLVHCAPGHGKEDYEVGRENNLDMLCPVGSDGILDSSAGKYAGKKARIVDGEIIEDLKKDGFLVLAEKHEHDYPLCWRDKSPLLMITQPQWFLKISAIHKKLLEENEKTNWVPDYMKLRMKAWLEGISDWPISRQRYWGTPLPIWSGEDGEVIVVGSLEELKKLSGVKDIELHKPGIDKITIKKGGKIFKRIPEVLDVWFDSGVSSWAALGFPADKKKFKKYWPADFNVEGKDQFRGWWNSQLILSTIAFDKKPFLNVSVHGMILDISKRKMSKSLGNIVSPEDIIKKYSRDYLRYYLAKMSRGEDITFDEKDFKEIQGFFRVLTNVNAFANQLQAKKARRNIEDRWILSKFNNLIKEIMTGYNNYRFYEVVQKIERFLVFDLSKTYIQMIRERADETFDIVNEIRLGLLKILAPIIPFSTEILWQELKTRGLVKEKSVHLSEMPSFDAKKVDNELEKEFELVVKYIELGLRERDKAGVGLKWPLQKALLTGEKVGAELGEIVARQLNVKKIEFSKGVELRTELDLNMTDELEAEGFAREIARKIQAERKNLGLIKSDEIFLTLRLDKELYKRVMKNKDYIANRVNAKKINFTEENCEFNFEIKNEKIGFSFTKI